MGRWTDRVRTPRVSGQPLKEGQESWHVEVERAIAKREALKEQGLYKAPEHQCTAMTTGTYGPQRRCSMSAIRGGTVCVAHGARAKNIRKAANRRVLEELDPTLSAMIKIRDQEEHWPAAQRAAEWLAKQAMGEPKKAGTTNGTHTVNIGLAIGGLPRKAITATVTTPAVEGTVDDE